LQLAKSRETARNYIEMIEKKSRTNGESQAMTPAKKVYWQKQRNDKMKDNWCS
jgi:DNA-binding CsgD family transcriptional regulator